MDGGWGVSEGVKRGGELLHPLSALHPFIALHPLARYTPLAHCNPLSALHPHRALHPLTCSSPSSAARSMIRLYSARPSAVEMSIWKSFSHLQSKHGQSVAQDILMVS